MDQRRPWRIRWRNDTNRQQLDSPCLETFELTELSPDSLPSRNHTYQSLTLHVRVADTGSGKFELNAIIES